MRSPRPLCVAQVCTCSIAAMQSAAAVVPTVSASFNSNPILEGNEGTLSLTLSNPGSSLVTNVSVEDRFDGRPLLSSDVASP